MKRGILKYKKTKKFQGGGSVAYSKVPVYDKSKDADYIQGQALKKRDAAQDIAAAKAKAKAEAAKSKAKASEYKTLLANQFEPDYLDKSGVLSTHKLLNGEIEKVRTGINNQIWGKGMKWFSGDGVAALAAAQKKVAELTSTALIVDEARKKSFDAISSNKDISGRMSVHSGRIRVIDRDTQQTKWVDAVEVLKDSQEEQQNRKYAQLTTLSAIHYRDKEAPLDGEAYNEISGLLGGKDFVKAHIQPFSSKVDPNTLETTYDIGNHKLNKLEILDAVDSYTNSITVRTKGNAYNLAGAVDASYREIRSDNAAGDYLMSVALQDPAATERILKASRGEMKTEAGEEISAEMQLEIEKKAIAFKYATLGEFSSVTRKVNKNTESSEATGNRLATDKKNQHVTQTLTGANTKPVTLIETAYWSTSKFGDTLKHFIPAFEVPGLSNPIAELQSAALGSTKVGEYEATLAKLPEDYTPFMHTGNIQAHDGTRLSDAFGMKPVDVLATGVISDPTNMHLVYVPTNKNDEVVKDFPDFLNGYHEIFVALKDRHTALHTAAILSPSALDRLLRIQTLTDMYGYKNQMYTKTLNLLLTGDENVSGLDATGNIILGQEDVAIKTTPMITARVMVELTNSNLETFKANQKKNKTLNIAKIYSEVISDTEKEETARYYKLRGSIPYDGDSWTDVYASRYPDQKLVEIEAMWKVENYQRISETIGPLSKQHQANLIKTTSLSMHDLLTQLEK